MARLENGELDINSFVDFVGDDRYKELLDVKSRLESLNQYVDEMIVYTAAEKTKLAEIEANANNYALSAATASTLGGVKVTAGNGLSISDGTVAMGLATTTAAGAMTAADKTKLDGGIPDGSTFTLLSNNVASVTVNTTSYKAFYVCKNGGDGNYHVAGYATRAFLVATGMKGIVIPDNNGSSAGSTWFAITDTAITRSGGAAAATQYRVYGIK